MEWLQPVCNIIIIVGGAIMTIKNVSEWFGKPIRFFKQKTDINFEDKVCAIVKKVLPQMFLEHDIETRNKYRADREAYLQDIKAQVLKSIQGELGQIAQLSEKYEALVISAKDVLREKIMGIYHKNKRERTLTLSEKEALDQYYIDYKAMKGNSYIDKYYKRMKKWKVDEDDYYEDEDDAL